MRAITAPLVAGSPHRSLPKILITLSLVSLSILLILIFFDRFPIENTSLGIDWLDIHDDIQPGQISYHPGEPGLRITPWTLPFVAPLGYLSFRASWGLMTLATLAVLLLSVPPMRSRTRWIASLLVLASSFPVLRHVADGNLEGLVLAGSLMALYGYRIGNPAIFALGVLLGTAKPQGTWLLMPVLGVFALSNYPARWWLRALVVGLAIAVPTILWQGIPWLEMMVSMPRSGPGDMTVAAVLSRANVQIVLPVFWLLILGITLWLAFRDGRTFTRRKAALLMAASMLLAPYASGISFVTLFAFGVIPLLETAPRAGIALVILSNIPYLLYPGFAHNYGNYYAFLTLLLVWLTACWLVHREWWRPDALRELTPRTSTP